MKPINIAFDGNYFLHRCIGVINWKLYKTAGKLILQDEQSRNVLLTEMTKHFLSFFNKHEHVNFKRVIFVADSKSWRYDEYDKYKGDRAGKKKKANENIDWSQIHSVLTEFMELLNSHNVITTKVNKLEGDDVLFLWSKYITNTLKESVIVIASDIDLTQFNSVNTRNNTFVAHYNINGDGSFVLHPDMMNYVKNIPTPKFDMFNMNESSNARVNIQFLTNVINQPNVTYIYPHEILFKKIISGDRGDCIPNIYTGFGEGTSKKFVEFLTNKKGYDLKNIVNKFIENDVDYITEIVNLIEGFAYLTPYVKVVKIDVNEVVKTIQQNTRLVYISPNYFPKQSILDFLENVKLNKSKIANIKLLTKENILGDLVVNELVDKTMFNEKLLKTLR